MVLSVKVLSTRSTHFFIALSTFMEIPHCTHILMGFGQPLPLTVMPSSSRRYSFTSEQTQL